MLHPRRHLQHTEIALALVDAGAGPRLKNVANETALDVAFPTLKANHGAVRAPKSGST